MTVQNTVCVKNTVEGQEKTATESSISKATTGSPYIAESPSPGGKWLVLLAIGIGTFMTALDTSVVNSILPVLNRSFGSEIDAIEWVVVIYLLVVSGLLLSFGRLGDLQGHRSVYLAGFFVFIASSALCGIAPTVWALIIFRGTQALGAAMLSANSPAILTKSFPGSQRGQALGLQATMTYLGLTVGPSLGGILTDWLGWRSVFYINIPVGLFAFFLSLRHIPKDSPSIKTNRFDMPGAFAFLVGLVSLLLALNQGHSWGWLSLPTLALLLLAFTSLGVFIRIEVRVSSPMLDLKLFSSRIFSTAVASAVLNYICVYSIMFLMPFYLIQGRHFSPSQSGLMLSAMPVVMAVMAPISGTISDRIGNRTPATTGMVFLSFGLFLLSRLNATSSLGTIILALCISGMGIGTFISPNNSALMGSAPRPRQGTAAGVLATARNVGMVLGIGLSGAILTTVLALKGSGPSNNLYEAIHISFIISTGIAIAGILTSSARGNGTEKTQAKPLIQTGKEI